VVHLAVQPVPEETGPGGVAPPGGSPVGESPASTVREKRSAAAAPGAAARGANPPCSGGIALPPAPVLNIRYNPPPAGGPTG
jgi:hypothetical protein